MQKLRMWDVSVENAARHVRNQDARSALRTSTKKVQAAIVTGDAEAVAARQREAARALDKAAAKGIVHKRTVARRKSRLAKAANAAAASA
jgi:small subunit ribosomal protein S20